MRLPGKSLKPFGTSTLVGYLVGRIRRARTLDEIVIATTDCPADDVLEAEALRLGVDCFRGSETDVLGRYVAAARQSHADIVVRVTGDNPFTDPESIDRAVKAIAAGYDYAIEMNMPVGMTGEALSRAALEFIDKVGNTPEWREHVTLYAKQNPGMLRCAFLSAPPDVARPDLSFTIDREEDYASMCAIERQLPGPHFSTESAIGVAEIYASTASGRGVC